MHRLNTEAVSIFQHSDRLQAKCLTAENAILDQIFFPYWLHTQKKICCNKIFLVQPHLYISLGFTPF